MVIHLVRHARDRFHLETAGIASGDAGKKWTRDACAAAVTAARTVAFVPSANGARCQSSLSRAPRRWPQFTKRRPRDSRRARLAPRACFYALSRPPRGRLPFLRSRSSSRSRRGLCAILVERSGPPRGSFRDSFCSNFQQSGLRVRVSSVACTEKNVSRGTEYEGTTDNCSAKVRERIDSTCMSPQRK
ncbi:uncharacterized protein LOC143185918 [Calliopsis andreniformis]|uniref:uncharacterized protein LOC143185918 n=1 Tax=Calliopsis andreniformis TaxID=337506 RepID=UPI003FCD7FE5